MTSVVSRVCGPLFDVVAAWLLSIVTTVGQRLASGPSGRTVKFAPPVSKMNAPACWNTLVHVDMRICASAAFSRWIAVALLRKPPATLAGGAAGGDAARRRRRPAPLATRPPDARVPSCHHPRDQRFVSFAHYGRVYAEAAEKFQRLGARGRRATAVAVRGVDQRAATVGRIEVGVGIAGPSIAGELWISGWPLHSTSQ